MKAPHGRTPRGGGFGREVLFTKGALREFLWGTFRVCFLGALREFSVGTFRVYLGFRV